jgi:hypothetical protein
MIYLYLLLYGLLLLYGAAKLGIGPEEARLALEHPFVHFFYLLWPGSELAVRLPQIVVMLLDVYLLHLLARRYLRTRQDAFWATFLFSFLPAVIASAVVINKSPYIILVTLLFLLLYDSPRRLIAYLIAATALFLDHSFAVLFLAMGLYGLYYKRYDTIYFFGLFFASIALFGFDVGGKPKNYFLDTFAIFTAIFSPLVFLYFFYAIYRILIRGQKDALWFVSATAFLFSLALSFRQRVSLIDFAPFAVVGVVVMVRVFVHSLRVRLRRHRRYLQYGFALAVVVLGVNVALLFFHDIIFHFINPKEHFAYRHYEAKYGALSLKRLGVECVMPPKDLAWQLQFYKVGVCEDAVLQRKIEKGCKPLVMETPEGLDIALCLKKKM